MRILSRQDVVVFFRAARLDCSRIAASCRPVGLLCWLVFSCERPARRRPITSPRISAWPFEVQIIRPECVKWAVCGATAPSQDSAARRLTLSPQSPERITATRAASRPDAPHFKTPRRAIARSRVAGLIIFSLPTSNGWRNMELRKLELIFHRLSGCIRRVKRDCEF